MEIIKVSNLVKTFKLSKKQQKIEKTKETLKTAVSGLSFSVNEGEIYGLLGPNGAGKTTTLRMLSTLIKPDSGDALINNYSIVNNQNEVRKSIGFLTSELKLEEFFTPNYLYNFFSDLHGISTDVRDSRKEKLFSMFGIDKFQEVKVSDLSTGMKQKISLVISLVHDPSIIIFDEPTNGLDIITAKTVTDFLQVLKNEGKTIIISTHIFSLVEKLCDRVGIVVNGQMVYEDKLDNITDLESVFFDVYKKSVGGVDFE